MGEYRLNDDNVFKPSGQRMTPEEEMQSEKKGRTFFSHARQKRYGMFVKSL